MSRITCRCGEWLSNSNNPEIEFTVFSDEEWIELLDRTDQGEKLINLDVSKTTFWKCPNCGRLIFFEDYIDTPIAIYKPEK